VLASSDHAIEQVLRVLRKPRAEAQWTQVIAAVAQSDARFAAGSAAVLARAAPRSVAFEPPADPRCDAEATLWSPDGEDLGPGRPGVPRHRAFCLLVELKLGSGGPAARAYRDALDALPTGQRWLPSPRQRRWSGRRTCRPTIAGWDLFAGLPFTMSFMRCRIPTTSLQRSGGGGSQCCEDKEISGQWTSIRL
jgi:hypothetical protein